MPGLLSVPDPSSMPEGIFIAFKPDLLSLHIYIWFVSLIYTRFMQPPFIPDFILSVPNLRIPILFS